MPGRFAIAVAVLVAGRVFASMFSYECDSFPEEAGWERRLAGTPGAERRLVDGWFVQVVDLPDGRPGPNGDYDFYRRPLGEFADASTFFVEWRAVTDNPSWLLDVWAVPAVVSAAGRGAALYHTTLTESAVQLFRDTGIPRVILPVVSGVPHVYRVELRGGAWYGWYVDAQLVESGTPEARYPDPTAFLIWGAGREYVDATTRWDYVRYGRIPTDGSGDYDSDEDVDGGDFYFFHECLANRRPGINGGPGNDAGPGCRFADFDSDTDVDLLDFAGFQRTFTGGP